MRTNENKTRLATTKMYLFQLNKKPLRKLLYIPNNLNLDDCLHSRCCENWNLTNFNLGCAVTYVAIYILYSEFPYATHPWYVRSGNWTGVFKFYHEPAKENTLGIYGLCYSSGAFSRILPLWMAPVVTDLSRANDLCVDVVSGVCLVGGRRDHGFPGMSPLRIP
jgi:hypothetical protein